MNRVEMWNFHVLLGLLVVTGSNSPSWSTEAFNVETRHYTSYRQEFGSMFGFSVAEYRDKHARGWVIVGAPRAQTDVKNVYRGGSVYRCEVAIDDSCTQMMFDNKEHNVAEPPTHRGTFIQIDNKTMQWFGATVSTSQQDGGPILACAPRYVFFGVAGGRNLMDPLDSKENPTKEPAFGNQRDPIGTCWLENDPTARRYNSGTVREFSPCRTKNYGYHKQGSCMAGFSAALSKNGERLFVGAPGSWYWQGQTYSIPRQEFYRKFPYVPPHYKFFGAYSGQIFTQENRGKVVFTKQGDESHDDTYMGYSMTTGDFIGNGDGGTAVGKPRAAGLRGMVMLYSGNMTTIQTITGEDYMGSYFGYALAAGDIDNDGLDDLIVGAPMFTVPDNSEMYFETGRIYVYYGKGPKKYSEYVTRDGEFNRGRFGLSIAYLGDIDHDGYGDFAVGAPYGGPEGRGAVYIYQGSADGLLEKHSQVIYGREVNNNVQTFGFSIAGGLDLDGNSYPDIVVGAYDSSRAMFFRSRPVIKMVPEDTSVQLGLTKESVSLDERNCTLNDNRTRVTCLSLKTCFKYNGDGVQHKYNFNVQYVLDVKKTKSPRLCFLEYEGRHVLNETIEAYRDEKYCHTRKVYVVPNIRDKLTSLDAEMRMSLSDDLLTDNRPRDPSLNLRPVLARTSSRKDSIAIQKNCGSDDICTPDLQLTCKSSVNDYLMGSEEKIIFNVTVQNMREDAFEATYYLALPPGIDFVKTERIDKLEIPVQCSPPKLSNNNTLKCDIGNPLPERHLVKFNVILQPKVGKYEEVSKYEFFMETNSSNPEKFETTRDNRRHITVDIWVNTELIIEGESKPKEVYYNPDNYTSTEVTKESEYGPGFVHNYTIRNRGPSIIEEAEIYLVWPIKTLAGDDFFYLLEQPETSSNINCVTANSNALSLQLEQKVRGWQESRPPSPSFNTPDRTPAVNEGPSRGGNSQSTHTEGEKSVVTHHATNTSHNTVVGPNGSVTVVEDVWTNDGGKIQTKNVSTTVTEETVRREESIAYNKRRKEEEEAKRTGTNTPQYTYGTEKHFESSGGGSTSHGGSSHVFTHSGEPSVFGKAIHTEDRISGDREENVGGSDFVNRARNITAAQDLERILDTLTRDTVGSVFRRGGTRYLRFMGRFRLSEDGREYIEFQDGTMFPLENRYGDQSYGTDEENISKQNSFSFIEGSIITGQDGRGIIQLRDGRKFHLQRSYGYSREYSYTREGGSRRQGVANFPSPSVYRGTTESYGVSWSAESSDRHRDVDREVETHSSRTHEVRRTYERKEGSRVHERNEDIEDSYGEVPAQYRSGTYNRGSRSRREGDAVSVEDFRKYEKRRRLQKRDADEDYVDNDEFRNDESELNKDLPVVPSCKGVHCVNLVCTLGTLKKDEEAWISARYRVKATTLQKIVRQEELKVSTHLVSRVTKLPYVGEPAKDIINNQEIYTILKPHAKTPEPEPVPLWIVVLSACAGVIILLLLIFLLHKCGFFKRNRPMDGPERQPLNRNGHYQGDDHL